MAKNLSKEEDKVLSKIGFFIIGELDAGVPDEQIEEKLVEGLNIPREIAQSFLKSAKEARLLALQQTAVDIQNRYISLEKAKSRMKWGGLYLIAGGLITGGTYLFAPSGGGYVICWGAMLIGAIYFFSGLIEWLNNN